MNPQQAQSNYDKAIRLHQQGKLVKAIQLYRKVLKTFPKLDAVHTNLGMALYQYGQHDQALQALDKAIKINPTNMDAYRNRAATLMALDQNDQAAEIYEMLVKSLPDDANMAYNYANLLFQMGDVEGAERMFLQAIKSNSQLAPAHYNLGFLYMKDGRSPEAEASFRKAIGIKPDYASAYLNLGNLEADQGKLDSALTNFKLAVEVEPENALALNGLAKAYCDLGKGEEALVEAEKSIALDPGIADSWIFMGNALSLIGKEGKAKKAFEKALEIDPDHPIAWQNLARSVSWNVPSWHFTMLADDARNVAYRNAIEANITEGDLVLDIGTGSGLLSMMAARAGAGKVVGCEVVNDLAVVAKRVIAKNGYADKIDVVNKYSGTIKVGEELPEKADLLVSEILDGAVIGEGVLASHRHAMKELVKPGGKVIPARTQCYLQLIDLPNRRPTWPIKEIEGFDLSEMGEFQRLDQAQIMHLGNEDSLGLSEVHALWNLDLANIPNAVSDDAPETWIITLTGTEKGVAHAVALWFDLWVDKKTMVSTEPGGELKHWGQSVYFFPKDIEVEAGQKIQIKVMRGETAWRFEPISINL